eukprot:Skav218936  [mRNA]  locus=scaffold678:134707:139834:+ [translate_table: standard]
MVLADFLSCAVAVRGLCLCCSRCGCSRETLGGEVHAGQVLRMVQWSFDPVTWLKLRGLLTLMATAGIGQLTAGLVVEPAGLTLRLHWGRGLCCRATDADGGNDRFRATEYAAGGPRSSRGDWRICGGLFQYDFSELQRSGRTDRDVVVQEEIENKKEYLESVKDANSHGVISRETLEQSFENETIMAFFNALRLDWKISVPDAATLFDLLDFDGSEELDIDEFLLGCYQLQGDATGVDAKITQAEIRYVKQVVLGLKDPTAPPAE